MMLRKSYLTQIKAGFQSHRVVALLGARQVGKSTLAKEFIKSVAGEKHFFDLEDPLDSTRLDNPMLTLSELKGMIIIDEIQRKPELFAALRVLADQKKNKFLILGSASPQLIKGSSETLAGRIAFIEVRPFSIREDTANQKLWLRGGYPRAYLAKNEADSYLWIKNYTATFLERDIPSLGFNLSANTMRKFWMMLAHYHGNIFNASEIGKSLGVSGQSVRRYLDILTQTYMIRELQPWYENIEKRQVKSPKIYFRDSGILHYLLGLQKLSGIKNHPKLGSSWEGFALEQLTTYLNLSAEEVYFWGTHSDAEIDLIAIMSGRKIGFEFKYADVPNATKSMHISQKDLNLEKIFVFYPGDKNFKMDQKIFAVGLDNLKKFSID